MPVERPLELYTPLDYLDLAKQLPLALTMRRWNGVSAKALAERFRSPVLRRVVRHFSSPVLFEMFVLAEMDLRRCARKKWQYLTGRKSSSIMRCP